MIGNIISHYKVLEKLGEGGMGVVYKVEDTKLQREVALKLLRPEAMGDPEAKRRFMREARAASKLNHPNIATIHEIDEWHGRDYICMEYIAGQTLQKIIADSLPQLLNLQQITDYAIQIAGALLEAHEHNIIHRDIKSENIMVTSKGQIKVMDFGLAKIAGTATKTQIGTTAGTIAYMSPEQTRGETVDHRSDIWSFGVVLYEMITGKLPFKGGYEQAVIYAIINKKPVPVEKLRPEISPELLRIVNKVLEKEPDNRYRSTDELVVDLKRSNQNPSQDIRAIPPIRKINFIKNNIKKFGRLYVAVLVLLIITFASITILNKRSNSTKTQQQVYTIPFTTFAGSEIYPDFSPFGNQIAFAWNGSSENNYDIYIKAIDSDHPYQVTRHPGDDLCPAYSPDGNYIAFIRQTANQNSLNILEILGGNERRLVPLNVDVSSGDYFISIDWSPDGASIVYSDRDSLKSSICLYSLSIDGLIKHKISSPPLETFADVYPRFSPNNKFLAFIRATSFMASDLYLLQLDSGELKQLTFDNSLIMSVDWTSDSRELVFSSNRGVQMGLWKISVDGGESKPVVFNGRPSNLSVSTRAEMIACQSRIVNTNILRTRLSNRNGENSILEKFTITTESDVDAQYSPNGEHIAFYSTRSGKYEVWTCDSTGNNMTRLTYTDGPMTGHPWWSPDGKRICFNSRPAGNTDVYIMDLESRRIEQITHESSVDRRPTWSKDGKSIYFSSNRSGRFEMWKIDLATNDQKQITENGGEFGVDSFDGKWLFFHKQRNGLGLWRIPVDGGPETCVLNIKTKWINWSLVQKGIYYLKQEDADRYILEFYDFATAEITPITSLQQKIIWTMTISPDEKTLLTVPWKSESDIILVKNFR